MILDDDGTRLDIIDYEEGRTTVYLTTPGGSQICAIVSTQQLVDRIHELYPDVKPSPPKPKVGDRVQTKYSHLGTIEAVRDGWAWIWHDDDPTPIGYKFDTLTRIKRAEP